MELPTYTNIWKIEKRLYKLYDFRLPMPLPVGQVAAFLAIAVPYTLILTMAGMPFGHSWLWLYILPPAVLAWLVTRPVLEGKRLPELVLSQLRYLTEPRVWCRMAPLSEPDQVAVVATVWRSAALAAATAIAAQPFGAVAEVAEQDAAWSDALRSDAARSDALRSDAAGDAGDPGLVEVADAAPEAADAAVPMILKDLAGQSPSDPSGSWKLAESEPSADESAAVERVVVRSTALAHGTRASGRGASGRGATGNGSGTSDARVSGTESSRGGGGAAESSRAAGSAAEIAAAEDSDPAIGSGTVESGEAAPPTRPAWPERPSIGQSIPAQIAGSARAPAPPHTATRPGLTVRTDGTVSRDLPVVERALRRAPDRRNGGWGDHVVVVPGGHRPGKPDLLQRDRGRARLPLAGPARIVVLGCTAGAGQTTTTLLTGQVLASIRGEAVAVVDIGPGPGSLTEQARLVPRLLPSRRGANGRIGNGYERERRLQVVTPDRQAAEPADAGELIGAVAARYPLTLVDPEASQVPRSLQVATQVVLVVPANGDAAGALAMTLEWLEANGYEALGCAAVVVLNGVSQQTSAHSDRAAAVANGRCRAIVSIPWDSRLAAGESLGADTIHAYTALAGVLVAGLTHEAQRAGVPEAAAADTGSRFR